jgi:hypothetical protein
MLHNVKGCQALGQQLKFSRLCRSAYAYSLMGGAVMSILERVCSICQIDRPGNAWRTVLQMSAWREVLKSLGSLHGSVGDARG